MKKAVVFLDYNDTFDDVGLDKGQVFICALKRLIKLYNKNIDIVVITAAKTKDEFNIKSDLSETLSHFPPLIKERFSHLIENNCKYISRIVHDNFMPTIGKRTVLSTLDGTKKDGVETFLKRFYFEEKLDACIFVGDSQPLDLVMMDADVGTANKVFVYANKKMLKSEKFPIYKLSFKINTTKFNYAKDIQQKTTSQNLIIHTSNKSFGAGKGLEAATCLLEGRHKEEKTKN